ncbi:hypothetical protein PNEG_02614 [Pneumocystis murina B123]|uniref:Uncharacterized protein n=1 Tax=Pneumocystis murina (strain B123) TaxID=1069680 RepID=M7NNZ7_PNEMU|nr:hypothetical protein PNEG_02614 [Pneumocystis murina B123]EMR08826.1 hypothetical protein PNEG_02614 [Pneumocystis murina B123]
MDILPHNDPESSSLEDLEPSLLENLDSIELEKLENEAINICSQHYNRNLYQFYINQADIQDQIQAKYQADTLRDTYEKYPLHLYDRIHVQDNIYRENIQKDILFLDTKNTFYNSIHSDFFNIDKHDRINQWDNMYQPSNMSPRDKYEKLVSWDKQILKAEEMQVVDAKGTVLQDEITKSQSYIRSFQLERDEFKVVARSKSKELVMTQTLFDKKQQLYTSPIENLQKQYVFSSEKHIVTQKEMEDNLNQVLTENRFQKKGLQEVEELITQFEYPKKQVNCSFNMPFEFPTKKAFESEEKVIDSPVKRKRRSKKYVSLDNTVHEYEYVMGNYYLKNNENLELRVISKAIFQQINDNKKLQFIEELFDYRIDYIFKYNDSTIFDILSSYTLPGFSVSVSSIVVKFITRSLTTLNPVLVFLFYLMDYVMVIWKICLEKNYKEPIRYMVSFVHFMFVFQLHIFNELVNVDKIEFLLMLLQNTIMEYMAVTKEIKVFGYIDEFVIQKCLEILNIIVSLSQENTQIVYKISLFLEFNQILILLNPLHNLLFIKKTLKFLNKCILLNCIQYTVKKDDLICFSDYFSKILDIVSRYLTEKYENYDIFERMDLKLETVMFLNTIISASVNGKDLLSLNVVVVSQLCRCLAELISLHDTSEISRQRINLIQSIVFILHEIISPINISLHFAQPWTRYAYIVSMTRLSFAEDEDDHGKDIFNDRTIEFARDLLEIVVDSEEGNELYGLFNISN